MKTYEVFYRKRGLPESDLKKIEIEAESFSGATYLAQKEIGEDYVVVSTKQLKEENKNDNARELSEADKSCDS